MASGYRVKSAAEAFAALEDKVAISKLKQSLRKQTKFKTATAGAIAREAHKRLALRLASQKQFAPHVEFFRQDADLTHQQIKAAQERQERRRISRRKSEARANYKQIANVRHRINRYINKVVNKYGELSEEMNFGVSKAHVKKVLEKYKKKHLRIVKGKIKKSGNIPDFNRPKIPRLKKYIDFEGEIKREITFDRKAGLLTYLESISDQMVKFMRSLSPESEAKRHLSQDFFETVNSQDSTFLDAFMIFRGGNLDSEANQAILRKLAKMFNYNSVDELLHDMKELTWKQVYKRQKKDN